jgi:signal peptidase I
MARHWGRRFGGAAASFVAPGSGQWLCGRSKRAVGFLLAMMVPTMAAPFVGAWAVFLATSVRFVAAAEVFFGRVESALPRRAVPGMGVLLGLGLIFTIVVRWQYMAGFVIPTGGMQPTLQPGDRFMVRKFGLPPAVGDVAVFGGPEGSGDWVQRVVARGGQVVSVRSGQLFIDGQARTDAAGAPCKVWNHGEQVDAVCHRERLGDHEYRIAVRPIEGSSMDYPGPNGCGSRMEAAGDSCRVPAGALFLLGDNRNDSFDSRELGALAEGDVKAVALFVWHSKSGFHLSGSIP